MELKCRFLTVFLIYFVLLGCSQVSTKKLDKDHRRPNYFITKHNVYPNADKPTPEEIYVFDVKAYKSTSIEEQKKYRFYALNFFYRFQDLRICSSKTNPYFYETNGGKRSVYKLVNNQGAEAGALMNISFNTYNYPVKWKHWPNNKTKKTTLQLRILEEPYVNQNKELVALAGFDKFSCIGCDNKGLPPIVMQDRDHPEAFTFLLMQQSNEELVFSSIDDDLIIRLIPEGRKCNSVSEK